MRFPITIALLLVAGCDGASMSSYQPAPAGVPEEVNARCNLLGSQSPENDVAVRANCLRAWRASGTLPPLR